MVVNAEVNQTNKTTLRSARRSVVENSLTGPTLLEMSGLRVNQALERLGSNASTEELSIVPLHLRSCWLQRSLVSIHVSTQPGQGEDFQCNASGFVAQYLCFS